jgi:hypothetical protein
MAGDAPVGASRLLSRLANLYEMISGRTPRLPAWRPGILLLAVRQNGLRLPAPRLPIHGHAPAAVAEADLAVGEAISRN